ncbi:hypothetical protein ACFQO1_10355 [Jejudonia soesokkakensis]|uniref:Uncharacterized protein n=1 Tax=Jejudonia soesokkakensis TaxID=1323432 RepID=A0ABW2MWF8_9FLAO
MKRTGNPNDYEKIDNRLIATITGTEIINGKTYYVFENSSQGIATCSACDNCIGNNKVREADGFLKDDAGILQFVNQASEPYMIGSYNFGDIFGKYSQAVVFGTPEGEYFDLTTNEIYVILPNSETSEGIDVLAYKECERLLGRSISAISDSRPIYYTLFVENVILPD